MRRQSCNCLLIAGCDELRGAQSGYQPNTGTASMTPQLFPDAEPLLFSLKMKADGPYKVWRKREEGELRAESSCLTWSPSLLPRAVALAKTES